MLLTLSHTIRELLTVTTQVSYSPLPSAAVAVMVVLPFLSAVTRPVALTVATELSELVHMMDLLLASDGYMYADS